MRRTRERHAFAVHLWVLGQTWCEENKWIERLHSSTMSIRGSRKSSGVSWSGRPWRSYSIFGGKTDSETESPPKVLLFQRRRTPAEHEHRAEATTDNLDPLSQSQSQPSSFIPTTTNVSLVRYLSVFAVLSIVDVRLIRFHP